MLVYQRLVSPELFQECRVAGSQFAPSIMDAPWMRTMGRNSWEVGILGEKEYKKCPTISHEFWG